MAENFLLKLEQFRGLETSDAAGNTVSVGKSPDMLNFKINENFDLEKREGFVPVFETADRIRGAWAGKNGGKEWYLVVVGDCLYASETGFDAMEPIAETVPGEESVSFISFYDGIYLLTGQGIRRFDGEALSSIEPHIPTVMISTEPKGSGVTFEEPNLLTPQCRQIFSSDGNSLNFNLFTRFVSHVDSVKVDGVELEKTQYYWDEAYCKLIFLEVPRAGVDNIEVVFTLLREDVSDRIQHCRFGVGFGGANDTRVFLYGNRDTPAMRYHSGVVDGKPSFAYFPELGYTLVGSGSPITGILRHYDRQLIFTEEAAYYSYLEYTVGENGKLVASFPVFPLSDDCGCVPQGQALLMENNPCTLTQTGLVEWVSTNIRDERNARSISDSIARALQKEDATQGILFFRKATSELYLAFSGRIYVYCKKLNLFYYYEVPPLSGFVEVGNSFYFFTQNAVCRVEGNLDNGQPIACRWQSGALFLGDGAREKNLYAMTLLAETQALTRAEVTLSEENTQRQMKRTLVLPEGNQISSAFVRLPLRRTRLVNVGIQTQGGEDLKIRALQLRGRVIGR